MIWVILIVTSYFFVGFICMVATFCLHVWQIKNKTVVRGEDGAYVRNGVRTADLITVMCFWPFLAIFNFFGTIVPFVVRKAEKLALEFLEK